tara:strand:+ start:209 stop:529 length:321 start_codon:yes stop_codon:yes gene_type:complete
MKITKQKLKQIIKEELEMVLNESNIMDKLASMQDKGGGEKYIAQQIIDTARTILSYEHLSDKYKAMVDELIDFNKQQFGSDAGAQGTWGRSSEPAWQDIPELELDL